MNSFIKIFNGYVVQSYAKSSDEKFYCMEQKFVLGDSISFEDDKGNSIDAPEHMYQAYNMNLVNADQMVIAIESVLAGLKVDDEQSKQFEVEIDILITLLLSIKPLNICSIDSSCGIREDVLLDYCSNLVSYTTELLYQMNDQSDLNEIEPLRRAKAIIELYEK